MDYLWTNKYVLFALGVLTLVSFKQWWSLKKVKSQVDEFKTWSQEMHQYLESLYQRRG